MLEIIMARVNNFKAFDERKVHMITSNHGTIGIKNADFCGIFRKAITYMNIVITEKIIIGLFELLNKLRDFLIRKIIRIRLIITKKVPGTPKTPIVALYTVFAKGGYGKYS